MCQYTVCTIHSNLYMCQYTVCTIYSNLYMCHVTIHIVFLHTAGSLIISDTPVALGCFLSTYLCDILALSVGQGREPFVLRREREVCVNEIIEIIRSMGLHTHQLVHRTATKAKHSMHTLTTPLAYILISSTTYSTLLVWKYNYKLYTDPISVAKIVSWSSPSLGKQRTRW